MRTDAPKVLFDVCGLPSLLHVVRTCRALQPARLLVVVSEEIRQACQAALDGDPCPQANAVRLVVQEPQLGTGHAVAAAYAALPADESDDGDVLVLYGDGPLIEVSSLSRLLEQHRETAAGVTVMTSVREDPTGYGRIVLDGAGRVERIVEELDADTATRELREVNTGILAFAPGIGRRAVAALGNDNAKGEYYLTDTIEWIREQGRQGPAGAPGSTVERSTLEHAEEVDAFNSLAELANVRRLMRSRILRQHQENGVDIIDPDTTYIDVDVSIGPGSRILPCTVIGAGVSIGKDCMVGPFSHLRIGTRLEDRAEVGNFTETKKTVLGKGSKAKHLTYLGDARIGAATNIGCGTITANYDGKAKHVTKIGDGAFIGSGTVLIAPAEIGDGARTGAGAIVTRNTRVGVRETWIGVPARRLQSGGAGEEGADQAGSPRKGGTGT